MIVGEAIKISVLYKFLVTTSPRSDPHDNALTIQNLDNNILWHSWHGHLSFGCFSLLNKENKVSRLPNIQKTLVIWDICMLDKRSRIPFNSSSWKATIKLEFIFNDLFVTFAPHASNGVIYYLTSINDFTKKT